jgi:hypothetical protein
MGVRYTRKLTTRIWWWNGSCGQRVLSSVAFCRTTLQRVSATILPRVARRSPTWRSTWAPSPNTLRWSRCCGDSGVFCNSALRRSPTTTSDIRGAAFSPSPKAWSDRRERRLQGQLLQRPPLLPHMLPLLPHMLPLLPHMLPQLLLESEIKRKHLTSFIGWYQLLPRRQRTRAARSYRHRSRAGCVPVS